jgi:hypothetical protein
MSLCSNFIVFDPGEEEEEVERERERERERVVISRLQL